MDLVRQDLPYEGFVQLTNEIGNDITYDSAELYEWCTREKDPSPKPGGGTYDEAEQQDRNMGIFYRGGEPDWYYGNTDYLDSDGDGIFARDKLTNAYYYPECVSI